MGVKMTIEVIVDRDKCIGCGKCYNVCPKAGKIFKKDKNGKYYAYDTKFCFKCYACTGRCPVNAIIVRHKEEGEEEKNKGRKKREKIKL